MVTMELAPLYYDGFEATTEQAPLLPSLNLAIKKRKGPTLETAEYSILVSHYLFTFYFL